jgi:hypothetical protein
MVDEVAEVLLGDQRIEDFRINVGEGWGEVANDHPVSFDTDDACDVVLVGVFGDVRVTVRKAGVGGAPGEFFGDAVLVGVIVWCAERTRERRHSIALSAVLVEV